MPSTSEQKSSISDKLNSCSTGWVIIAVAVINFFAGKIGLLLAIPPGYATILWPPSGIALAVVLWRGNKVIPGIWFGSFLLNVGVGFDYDSIFAIVNSLIIPVTIATGSTLQAMAGAWLIRKFCGFPLNFINGLRIFKLLVLGGPISGLIACTSGVGVLLLTKTIHWSQAPLSWGTWLLGDTMGVLVFTPFLILYLLPRPLKTVNNIMLMQKTIPIAVLIIGLAIMAKFYGDSIQNVKNHTHVQFDISAGNLADSIHQRLNGYAQILRGGQGLFAASTSVERGEWHEYAKASNVQSQFPGIQGFGFSLRIPSSQIDDHIQKIRREGFPGYAIKPEGVRPEYNSIIYLEPFDFRNQRAFGYDMFSEPNRRAAMERARDTELPSISKKIILVQETDIDVQNGFLMYLPVYKNGLPHDTIEQRQISLLGYVYAPFRMNDFIDGILGGVDPNISLEIFDGTHPDETSMLYQSSAQSHEKAAGHVPMFKDVRELNFGGQTWTLLLSTTRRFENALNFHESRLILGGGTLVSLLLFGITSALLTTRMRAQALAENMTKELAESEEKYRELFDNAANIIQGVTPDGKFVYVNRAWKDKLGYTDDEIPRLTLIDIIHPNHKEACRDILEKLKRGHKIENLDIVLQTKSGKEIAVEGSATSKFEDGKLLYTRAILFDITERKRFEEQINLQMTALDSAANAIMITDPQGRIQWTNRAFTDITGYRREDIIGKTPRFLKSDRHDRAFYEQMWQTIKAGQIWHNEVINRRKDGSLYTEEMTLAPVKDEANHITNYVAIKQDISYRKKVEQMKNEFISTVSHELRTPLTAINGSIGLVLGGLTGDLSKETKSLLEVASRNCDRLIRLINDILDIEKIESGKLVLKLTPSPVDALIKSSIEANRPFADNLKVGLVMKECPSDIRINVDPDRFAQIMTNLISNACKYAPIGDAVEISAHRETGCVKVMIQDFGPGIPEEFRAHIFKKFSQADSSDARQKSGTGLGLNIAKSLVEGFGGKIGFDSQLGKGTTFYFEIPEWSENNQPKIAPTQGKKRLLLCDDCPQTIKVLSAIIERSGLAIDFDVAYNAGQVKHLIAQNNYSAMALDITLPGQDGFSLLRNLREQESTARLPVIIVSALAEDEELKRKARELRVSQWLTKPVMPKTFLESVKQAIGLQEPPGQSKKISTLLIERDDVQQHLILDAIAHISETTVAREKIDAEKLLMEKPFDVILTTESTLSGEWPTIFEHKDQSPLIVIYDGEAPAHLAQKVSSLVNRGGDFAADLSAALQRAVAPGRG